MGVESAIRMVRDKALKDIRETTYGHVDYCWQEETADEARVSRISSILMQLDADEKRIKAKYQKKIPEQKKEGVDKHAFLIYAEGGKDKVYSRFHKGDVKFYLNYNDQNVTVPLSVREVEKLVATLCHFLFSIPVSRIQEILGSITKRYF